MKLRIVKTLLEKEWRLFRAHTAVQLVLGLVAIFGVAVALSGARNTQQYLSIVYLPGGNEEFKNYLTSWEPDVRFYWAEAGYQPEPGEAVLQIPHELGRKTGGPIV